MKINTMIRTLFVFGFVTILADDTALARGRGGGMGGMRGGMGYSGGMRGGMGYSGGMRGGMGYSGGVRGGYTPSPSLSRPNMGSGYRPQGGRPGTGVSSRPSYGTGSRPSYGTGSRPSYGTGSRPSYGTGSRPSYGTGSRPSYGTGNQPNIGSGNRPNIGSGNRPNIGSGNRPNIGSSNQPNYGSGNRPSYGSGNRPDYGGGTNIGSNNRRTNININRIHINQNFGGWTGAGWGMGPFNRGGFRHGWVNGFWHGGRRGFATGLATGSLIGWGWGSTPYYWGYASYVNPFFVPVPVAVGGAQPAASSFNYAQPINTQAPPPDDSVVDSAELIFDNARAAFMQGNYNQAMDLINQVITQVPNDATAHEFRALVFFALKNYDQAAATLYPVLSVGPGWDWTTLVGLYPSLDVYTEQLRALEAACKANPESASNQFVLGYHYLTQGHTEAASHLFEDVARLQPSNQLAAQLAREFSKDDKDDKAPPAPAPVSTFEPEKDSLFGTWKASPSNDVSIELTLPEEGGFTWKVVQKGVPQTITGEFSASDDLLTLAQANNGPVMVGNLIWRDEKNFQFRLVNSDPNDPGLTFSKATQP